MIHIDTVKEELHTAIRECESFANMLVEKRNKIDSMIDSLNFFKKSLHDKDSILNAIELIENKTPDTTPQELMKKVCDLWNCTVEDIKNRKRTFELVTRRIIMCKILNLHFRSLTMLELSLLLGYHEHTASVYLLKCFNDRFSIADPAFMEHVKPVSYFLLVNTK